MKIVSKKAGLLILILLIQQISLVFTYSAEKSSLIIERNVFSSLPLFVATNVHGIRVYELNTYFQDDIERWKVRTSNLPAKIMTEGKRSEKFLAYFLTKNNKKIDNRQALSLAQIYIEEAKMEGVNHDIAFTQMCHETGFLKYTGSVRPDQNNFCGLGATNEFERGDEFSSVRIGIRAHIQHLKAYADQKEIMTELVDTRFKFIKRGSAQTVQELTGKWAQDTQYNFKIDRLLKDLYSL
ncbi:MAG: glucosaminidase domain-containing protein [Bacteroidetes bacterium]|nr:glucosaminidase domain-containing protein [Bacteroidota bacterium]